jgi:GT2 family glycosyltransferase/glycosyltransferase involved in cell wall biosynthesis
MSPAGDLMRILQIVHGFPPSGSGGAELYADSLARGLVDAGHDVAVFTREAIEERPEFSTRDEIRHGLRIRWINNTFRSVRTFDETYAAPAVDRQLARFLDLTRPEVAHVHHLTCLSTGILEVLGRAGVPVLLHLHDYWLLCHRGQLLDTEGRRCEGPGSAGCASCTGTAGALAPALLRAAPLVRSLRGTLPLLARRAASLAGDRRAGKARARHQSLRRLDHMRQRFGHVALAVAPSEHVRHRFADAGFPADRIEVSEYGIRAMSPGPRAARATPLRLGFLGTLMVSKAPHLLVEALAQLPPGSVEASIYGAPAPYHGDSSYSDEILARLDRPSVRLRGPIAHDAVPGALAAMDVLVFPSIWEETSGIGAREALAAGVPVVAARLGGIPEFVRHDDNGLLFTPGDAGDLARQLRRLVDEPDLLSRLRRGIRPVRSFEDNLAATLARYRSLSARAATPRPDVARQRVAAVVLNFRTPAETANTVAWLAMADPPLSSIVVVDNGDGVALRAALGDARGVTMIATGANLGFAEGCNVGIRAALETGADAVFLVNSDAAVPPSTVRHLLGALAAGAGIVGPVVRDRAHPDVIQSAGIDFDVRWGRMRNRTTLSDGAAPAPAISGCAMLIDRRVLEAVGPLPEGYFFGFEDIAFCQKAAAAGFDLRVCRHASVLHAGSATMGTSPDRLYYGTRNHLRLAHTMPAGSTARRLGRAGAIVAYSLAHAVKADGGSLVSRLRAVGHGLRDFARGRHGPRR